MRVLHCGGCLPSRRSILSNEASFPRPLIGRFYAISENSALLSTNVVRFFFLLEVTK